MDACFRIFPHEDHQAVAQRGCADLILGDFDMQLSWSGITADPAVSRGVDYKTLRDLDPILMILVLASQGFLEKLNHIIYNLEGK